MIGEEGPKVHCVLKSDHEHHGCRHQRRALAGGKPRRAIEGWPVGLSTLGSHLGPPTQRGPRQERLQVEILEGLSEISRPGRNNQIFLSHPDICNADVFLNKLVSIDPRMLLRYFNLPSFSITHMNLWTDTLPIVAQNRFNFTCNFNYEILATFKP